MRTVLRSPLDYFDILLKLTAVMERQAVALEKIEKELERVERAIRLRG